MTHTALAELLTRDLSSLDLVCLLLDGVHFGEHTCVVALGIGIDLDGTKHPLALVESASGERFRRALQESASGERFRRAPPRTPPWPVTCRELLTGLRERGLDTPGRSCASSTAPKALRRAILDVFDHPVIGRCQLHKIRNLRDKLP